MKNALMKNALTLLKDVFGYDRFRGGQEKIITEILGGRDCLGIMPTGAGKSICYQIPALLFEGTTVVVSPLISLMKDQVDTLNQIRIPAAFLNSSLHTTDYLQTLENAALGMYKILYVAPERLQSDSFLHLLEKMPISMVAIDEAHCVSQWGHDFRPSYVAVSSAFSTLPKRPIFAAFTATATELVKKDIISLLGLVNPFVLTTGFDRENLSFGVVSPKSKKDFVIQFLRKHKNECGIIYCLTRKTVDNLSTELTSLGFSISSYHAGLSEKTRIKSQEDFVFDRTSVMIATNAFGMGIDKSNVRFVIHYQMPKDIESYYQEAGRAGRDGVFSECILLFSRADIVTNQFLLSQNISLQDNRIEYAKLNDMIDYCNTDKCLRKYLLEYFGETPSFSSCHHCSSCNSEVELLDITEDAKKILSCIKRMGERFGSNLVTDVLKGANTAKINSMGFNSLSTYGIMRAYSKDTIKELISFLISEGYIRTIGTQFPVLELTPNANHVLFETTSVTIRRKIELTSKKENLPYNENLLASLKELRKKLAISLHVPPFIIFSDKSLLEMATYLPLTTEDMLKISGVGKQKLENYGEQFLDCITQFASNLSLPKVQKAEPCLKEDTKQTTYQLYQEGYSISEIASLRSLTRQTIESHLIACYEAGFSISLEKEIHTKYEKEIYAAISSLGTAKLKPIKEMLPKEVSYFDIRYYIASLGK